ncbi:MAG: P1 family peptidase [Gemmatimonadales bacterium]
MFPSITDVRGILVGHATDERGGTGCTVVLSPEGGMPCTVFVKGRATGTRELHACRPEALAGRVDAIVLTGGSAYGLAAADGVVRWLESRRRGFAVGPGVIPIVPAAVIFDLMPCGTFDARPTPEMGMQACGAAQTFVAEGSVGAGTGATVGKVLGAQFAMKGGVGTASVRAGDLVVGALAIVNAFGDVTDETGTVIAGARKEGGGFAQSAAYLAKGGMTAGALSPPYRTSASHNTTLVVIATNAKLGRLQLGGVAQAAGDALARRIVPVGTAFDGDLCFACSAGALEAPPIQVEQMAREATEAAVERGVRTAKGRDGVPGLAD